MANFFSRLINNIFQSNEVADEAFYEDLEDAMIMSDVGVTTTLKIIDAVKSEAKRQGVELTEEFAAWGVPTCWSLLDAQQTLPQNALLLASGGIRSAGDAARAFALGADAVGITAPLLRLVMEQGVDAAADYVEALAEGSSPRSESTDL